MSCRRGKSDQPIRHPRFAARRDRKSGLTKLLRSRLLVGDHHNQMIEGHAHALTGRSGKATPPALRFGKASMIRTKRPVTSFRSEG